MHQNSTFKSKSKEDIWVTFCICHDIAADGPSKIQAISKDLILKTLSGLFMGHTRELLYCCHGAR